MNLLEAIMSAQNGAAVNHLAQNFGLGEDRAASALQALLPALSAGLKLGHILGSKDVSRQVARSAAARTGIGEDILKKMLPVVAAMVMGSLSKQTSSQGRQAAAAGGGILGMLTPLLDANRDGSVADDVLGMLGGLFGRR
jgi:hypothetical protein